MKNAEAAEDESVAWLFNRGSLRVFSNAPLSLCAARSAFNAAAVVTATLDDISS